MNKNVKNPLFNPPPECGSDLSECLLSESEINELAGEAVALNALRIQNERRQKIRSSDRVTWMEKCRSWFSRYRTHFAFLTVCAIAFVIIATLFTETHVIYTASISTLKESEISLGLKPIKSFQDHALLFANENIPEMEQFEGKVKMTAGIIPIKCLSIVNPFPNPIQTEKIVAEIPSIKKSKIPPEMLENLLLRCSVKSSKEYPWPLDRDLDFSVKGIFAPGSKTALTLQVGTPLVVAVDLRKRQAGTLNIALRNTLVQHDGMSIALLREQLRDVRLMEGICTVFGTSPESVLRENNLRSFDQATATQYIYFDGFQAEVHDESSFAGYEPIH